MDLCTGRTPLEWEGQGTAFGGALAYQPVSFPLALAYEWPRGQGLARGTTIWGSGTNYHQHPSCQQFGGLLSGTRVASCYPNRPGTEAGRPQTRGQDGHVSG